MGHALEFLQADAYSRYFRKKLGKNNVFFNVGVDEHGLKVFNTAKENKKTPGEFLNELVPKWIDFCSKFKISYDNFYRTSSEQHHQGAKRVWEICNKNNDLYKKYYEGLYCIGCEAFILEKDLVGGKCPDHEQEPLKYAEENYFFKLSKYSKVIIEYLEKNTRFLKPDSKRTELINFIKEMEDISVSRNRSNLPWGVEVPDDPDHTIYVWFDALINYIRVIGFDDDPGRFESWWPGVQICGPDNLRFQGAIWQGILASLGLPFTNKLLVHGTALGLDGKKMSKTLGNGVAPLEQYEKYNSDICRFYILGILHPYLDCIYREEELKSAYNTYLANNYGNLLNRLIHLGIQKEIDILDNLKIQDDFRAKVGDFKTRTETAYENYELSEAAGIINELVSFGNQHIHEKEPWKQEAREAKVTLNNISHLLQIVSELYEPIIPDSAQKALNAISNKEKIILFPKLL